MSTSAPPSAQIRQAPIPAVTASQRVARLEWRIFLAGGFLLIAFWKVHPISNAFCHFTLGLVYGVLFVARAWAGVVRLIERHERQATP